MKLLQYIIHTTYISRMHLFTTPDFILHELMVTHIPNDFK
jgi:hypothetical protein